MVKIISVSSSTGRDRKSILLPAPSVETLQSTHAPSGRQESTTAHDIANCQCVRACGAIIVSLKRFLISLHASQHGRLPHLSSFSWSPYFVVAPSLGFPSRDAGRMARFESRVEIVLLVRLHSSPVPSQHSHSTPRTWPRPPHWRQSSGPASGGEHSFPMQSGSWHIGHGPAGDTRHRPSAIRRFASAQASGVVTCTR